MPPPSPRWSPTGSSCRSSRSRRHRLVVSHVRAESPTVTSVVVTGRDLDRLPVRAGQFFQWRFLDGEGSSRANPYSLSAAPDGRSLRITAQAVGDASSRLATLRPGTPVLVEGPYGRLHSGVRTRDRSVLIGAGIGITPLRALLEELPAGPDATVVIYRVGRQADIVLADELLASPGPRAPASSPSSATGAPRPGQLAAGRLRPPRRRGGVAAHRPRHRPARRLRVRQPGLDGRRHRRRQGGGRAGRVDPPRALQLLTPSRAHAPARPAPPTRPNRAAMRRIVTWAMSTLTVLVLLFSYSTSRSSVVATAETRPVTSSAQSAAGTTTDQRLRRPPAVRRHPTTRTLGRPDADAGRRRAAATASLHDLRR